MGPIPNWSARRARWPYALWASVLVFALLFGLRAAGVMQGVELSAYDALVRLRSGHVAPPRVALVTITEEDIRRLGRWPVPHGVLADALDAILAHEPRGIGVDIYLDVPIPPGRERLEALLTRHRNVVTAMKFGGDGVSGVGPIGVHAGTEQVGFTDFLLDPSGVVRRGLLFLDDGMSFEYSLALRVALLYLTREGALPRPDDRRHLRFGETAIAPLEGNEGAYVGEDSRGYQFLIDYREPPGAYPTATLHEVLDGSVDDDLFRDRIVFLGVVADSVKDIFITPYSARYSEARYTPGVELHAHVASQLLRITLDGDPITRSLEDWQEALWILAWTVLGGCLALRVRSAVPFAVAGVSGFVAIGLVALAAFYAYLWIPVVPAALGWALCAPVVAAFVSSRENAERKNLMSLFSKHISPQLANAIWEDREQFLAGDHPRPQRLTATAFFSDVASFTTISEKLEPQALMDWLDAYMQEMTPHVNRHGGVILRFIGDAIMAVFGIPVPRESEAEIRADAIDAVACALDMREALIAHNRVLAERGEPRIGMRIGILTGPMVAGTLGSDERVEYNVHGDTVNTAARLEGFEKESFVPDYLEDPCRILVGEATRALVADLFVLEPVGAVSLKGKAHKVGVYRVCGRRDIAGEGPGEDEAAARGSRDGPSRRVGTA